MGSAPTSCRYRERRERLLRAPAAISSNFGQKVGLWTDGSSQGSRESRHQVLAGLPFNQSAHRPDINVALVILRTTAGWVIN